jgi:hypothetical protein
MEGITERAFPEKVCRICTYLMIRDAIIRRQLYLKKSAPFSYLEKSTVLANNPALLNKNSK